jgi:hypothetical protein
MTKVSIGYARSLRRSGDSSLAMITSAIGEGNRRRSRAPVLVCSPAALLVISGGQNLVFPP